MLIGRFGDADALPADTKPCVVHHCEHGCHTALLGPNQPARRLVILHHTRGRPMNPEFVFQTDDVQRIGIPKAAVLIG